jgi:multidrug resistance efflux pump
MNTAHQNQVQRWLQQHCENAVHIAGGLVILTDGAQGQLLRAAQWPRNITFTQSLIETAQAAVQRDRSVIVTPAADDVGYNRVIALPLRDGKRTLGAIALAVQAQDGDAVNSMVKELENASVTLSASLQTTSTPANNNHDAARVLELQNTFLRHKTLSKGALAFVTQLAPLIGCDSVVMGVIDADVMSVLALSNSAEFKGEQELMRMMSAAMQECADQGAQVVYPAQANRPIQIVAAHAELHARSGQTLVSVPLVHAGRAVGTLLAQWHAPKPPHDAQIALLDSMSCMLGPWVKLSQRAERSWAARTADSLKANWHRLTRPNDPLPKMLLLGAAVVAAALAWWPLTYRVGASARIEGAVQRVVAAPIDSFLHKSHVRPGDIVRAGDLLVELADQDLLLEQRKLESALNQHENGFAAALARADRGQFVVSQGKANEARAQLELINQQLARTRLLAPIDGVVIKGDLSQTLGAPVQRGDVLMTLAPAERFRLIIQVDERDVSDIKVGQTGQLALAALPRDTLDFVVERVTPVASVHDGRNTFEVEARLNKNNPLLRPGLEGIAKVETGKQSLAWIWSHRVVDFLRLKLWSWGL